MNVLIACEESQAVCKAFRARGHRAFSCDLYECSGGHPEWHINGDALAVIDGNCKFKTQDGKEHEQRGQWDILIAHPPCTYLTVSGNRWFNVEKYGNKAEQRIKDREDAAEFFMKFINAKCERIAVENPIGYMNTHYRGADQIIQPWMFGHPVSKATCLWLKNLPPLRATKEVEPGEVDEYGFTIGGALRYATDESGKIISWNDPRTARERSKTFPGIAEAMADQWAKTYDIQTQLEL